MRIELDQLMAALIRHAVMIEGGFVAFLGNA